MAEPRLRGRRKKLPDTKNTVNRAGLDRAFGITQIESLFGVLPVFDISADGNLPATRQTVCAEMQKGPAEMIGGAPGRSFSATQVNWER